MPKPVGIFGNCDGKRAERIDSVRAGLATIAPKMQDRDWVLVHDAARPCLAKDDLRRLLDEQWDDDVGGPRHQVTRFHVIAPTSPARIASRVIAPGSMMPLPIVFATFSDRYAPTKLRVPAAITARRGEIDRVATDVAELLFGIAQRQYLDQSRIYVPR